MIIKILGTGCKKCDTVTKYAKEIIEENGLDATIEKVENMKDIMGYGIMATPGIVIDEEVVSSGTVPSKKKLKKMIMS
jgi:small redox-active disulfide protein 2